MNDTAVANAIRRKAEILKEIKEIDLFLSLHEKFSISPDAVKGNEPPASAPEDSSKVAAPEISESPLKEVSGVALEGPIREALGHAGRPLSLGKLMIELNKIGYKVPGEQPSKNLGTVLWRLKDKIINLKGFGYWMQDTPYSPAKYDPKTVELYLSMMRDDERP